MNVMKGTIHCNGVSLRYTIEGQGMPALVIGSAIYYPRSFSQGLRKHLKLAFCDWRGFTDTQETQVNLADLLQDIECLRKALDFERCLVMGHSAHALLALEYAKRYPQHVSHVAMIGISPNLSWEHASAAEKHWNESASPERKEAFAARVRELPDEILAQFHPSKRFVQWYVRRDPQAWYDFKFNSAFLWEGVHPNMPLFDFLYGEALREIDISLGLESFRIPVFLALGRYDYIIAPPSSWDSMRPRFHDLTVRVFEHSGHSPQYEEAQIFDRELLDWLTRKR